MSNETLEVIKPANAGFFCEAKKDLRFNDSKTIGEGRFELS